MGAREIYAKILFKKQYSEVGEGTQLGEYFSCMTEAMASTPSMKCVVVVHACRQRQQDEKFRVILGYMCC